MHLIVLKEQSCLAVLHELSVLLQCVAAKLQKLLIVVEQDSGGSLLIVAVVARVKYFYPDLTLLVEVARSNSIARGSRSEVDGNDVRVGTVFLEKSHLNLNGKLLFKSLSVMAFRTRVEERSRFEEPRAKLPSVPEEIKVRVPEPIKFRTDENVHKQKAEEHE